jgi:hypothetical protein
MMLGYIFRGVTYANDYEAHFQKAINDYQSGKIRGKRYAENASENGEGLPGKLEPI